MLSEQKQDFGPYLHRPIGVFVNDTALREQLRIILRALSFTNVTVYSVSGSYLGAAQELAASLLREHREDRLYLINPPLTIRDTGRRAKVERELPEFFEQVVSLVGRRRKNPEELLARCVPVFPDIELAAKREKQLAALARLGIGGAFILQKQKPLIGLSAKERQSVWDRNLRVRFGEVRDYLYDYLQQREEDILASLLESREERDLSKLKAEADRWVRKAETFARVGEYEKAVRCYKEAIDLYPKNPKVYFESGRVYIRLKQYPQAIHRFRQAEEIADAVPAPNKAIAEVRILQVRELLAQGMAADSPIVREYMDDALKHYTLALDKAEQMRPISEHEDGRRGEDAVAQIAGAIFKQDLETLLGPAHPSVSHFRRLAREAFSGLAGDRAETLSGSHLNYLGLAALHEGDFPEAERLFWEAARDGAHFYQACSNLNHMGHVLVQRDQAETAIALLEKLLEHGPPNQAYVCFTLAMALRARKRPVEAAGYLVEAIFHDVNLTNEEFFYEDEALNTITSQLLKLYAQATRLTTAAEPDREATQAAEIQDRLENAVLSEATEPALALARQIAVKVPHFYRRQEVLASDVIMDFLLHHFTNPALPDRTDRFLRTVATKDRNERSIPAALTAYVNLRARALFVLARGGDKGRAAHLLTRALCRYPKALGSAGFQSRETLTNLVRDIWDKLSTIATSRAAATPPNETATDSPQDTLGGYSSAQLSAIARDVSSKLTSLDTDES